LIFICTISVIGGCAFGSKSDVYEEKGIASWYGKDFHGKTTSSGERYDMFKYTAAHKTLPLGTKVKVTNLSNGKSVRVKINDRGPFVEGRIIDLSYVAALQIGIVKTGTAKVKIRVLD
jgi:rare lipoprotein A